ncbi:MAG: PilZ domain-containing protein [Candidatus Omnitrophica bacterium]|nr:PilZ domain-containing protein [Candidatus Omnitrophota bacterium]
MQERRKFVRLDTRLEISVTEVPGAPARKAVSKNLSGGGLCLVTEKEAPPGTQLQVAMKLPEQEQPVTFTAQVVWCEPYEIIGKGHRHRGVEMGARFVDISPKDYQAILQHVILSLKTPRQ